MNIERNDTGPQTASLTITISKADYAPALAKSLKEQGKKVALKGFRPGHAPAALVKKMYGGRALADALDRLVGETLNGYLKDNKLSLVGEPMPADGQPPIDVEAEPDEATFKFDIGLAPEVSASVDGLQVAALEPVAEEADIDAEIKTLANRFGTHVDVEAAGEQTLITGTVTLGDQRNEKGIMSVAVIKDEAQKARVIGKKVGETFQIDLRKAYPDDSELSYLLGIDKAAAAAVTEGQEASVEIAKLSEYRDAEVGPDLWAKAYPAEQPADEPAFRALVKASVERNAAQTEQLRFAAAARGALLAQAGELPLPEEFLKRWITTINKDNAEATPEVIEKELPTFLRALRWRLVRDKVASDNELKLSADDLLRHAQQEARMQFMRYGMVNMPDEQIMQYAASMVRDEKQREHLVEGALDDRVVELIREKGTVQVKQVTLNEFHNALVGAE